MNTERLVNTEELQKIMTDIITLFEKYRLNDIEIALVVSELARLYRDYHSIQTGKISKDL